MTLHARIEKACDDVSLYGSLVGAPGYGRTITLGVKRLHVQRLTSAILAVRWGSGVDRRDAWLEPMIRAALAKRRAKS